MDSSPYFNRFILNVNYIFRIKKTPGKIIYLIENKKLNFFDRNCKITVNLIGTSQKLNSCSK